jgi:hypothetical protein
VIEISPIRCVWNARRAAALATGWAFLTVAMCLVSPTTPAAPASALAQSEPTLGYKYDAPSAATTSTATTRSSPVRGYGIPSELSQPRFAASRNYRATKGARPASNAVSGKLLKRQLASEGQMAERGSPIFGAGTGRALRDSPRLAQTYGGGAEDWAKMGSSTYKDGGGLWDLFETHWYQNVRTGSAGRAEDEVPARSGLLRRLGWLARHSRKCPRRPSG